ncbi:hypothetical protein RND81_12G061100 [Saponaria officinalis]|uniref:Transposase n=1 Tax=Saponaria officinalis TaxID=3572 RepID=A0AAW1H5C7_SAPOF
MVKPHLTTDKKDSICIFLLGNSKDGLPEKGKISEAAAKWGVTRKTISTWWARAKKKMAIGELLHLPSGKLGNSNRPKIIIDKEFIKGIPKKNRSTIERLAKKLHIGYGTVQRWAKRGAIRKHTNAIHPSLTEGNKLQRLLFALRSTYFDKDQDVIKFKDMSNEIHIDEKWFYLTKTTENYYMLAEEDTPYRACQSKRFITKVMFICAVCRPLLGSDGQILFDGKIGIFPFIEREPAARNSKNRPADTLVTKATESVTKEVMKAYFRAVADSDEFNIHLVFQPPNSPDLNINDLGFFRSIQSLQNEVAASNTEDLVKAVECAFETHNPSKLNKNFLSLQAVMIEIMKCKGHNSFKLPHLSKDLLERQGILPKDLTVEKCLVRECLNYLHEHGHVSELQMLVNDLGGGLVEN